MIHMQTGVVSSGGGLVGVMRSGSIVNRSYSSSLVLDGAGFVGNLQASASVNNSYWDVDSSGQLLGCTGDATCGGGATAINASNRFDINTYSAFDISNDLSQTWTIFAFRTRPLLSSEYSTTITSPHQLQLINKDLTANYVQAQNINLNVVRSPNDIWGQDPVTGAGFIPLGDGSQFTGNYDGQSYTISNLFINRNTSNVNGLFYIVSGAELKNIHLQNVSIINPPIGGVAGALAGRASNSLINNVHVDGKVNGDTSTGGIVGTLGGSLLVNSSNQATVSGRIETGGLVGVMLGSSIENSYNLGNVTLSTPSSSSVGAGGLVGRTLRSTSSPNNQIRNSYSVGNVTGLK